MLEKKCESEINAITAEIVEETRKLLKGNIYKILLYGSYARGDFDNESDIDIMIIMNCQKEEVCRYRKQVSRVASRIGLENDIEISLLLRDRNTFEQSGDVLPFYKNIQREGVALYG
ncbi:MAG: nucleotidyltransferase domain-containing protein [Muribaculaceae bacterium]|nr:nucleotidyltransferase domain-containing protein [Roseburia sp.]MCM1431167.1 nucleotidyltransferase domain-containing protein [Muribaculaceae bacterium]MCM1492717.1 nucleotidyltransferase domain-containing protein [Muribaculaceae bacterium]